MIRDLFKHLLDSPVLFSRNTTEVFQFDPYKTQRCYQGCLLDLNQNLFRSNNKTLHGLKRSEASALTMTRIFLFSFSVLQAKILFTAAKKLNEFSQQIHYGSKNICEHSLNTLLAS